MIDGAGIPVEGDWMPCNAYYNYLPCRGQRVTESCMPVPLSSLAVAAVSEGPQYLVTTMCLRCGHRQTILSGVFVEP